MTYILSTEVLHKYIRVAIVRYDVEIKSMIVLVLVKTNMLQYVQDVRARGMGRGLSDHPVVLCKVRLVGAWIKIKVLARRIRSEKLREHQYREDFARSLEREGVEWEGDNNVGHMWKQVKGAMVESV